MPGAKQLIAWRKACVGYFLAECREFFACAIILLGSSSTRLWPVEVVPSPVARRRPMTPIVRTGGFPDVAVRDVRRLCVYTHPTGYRSRAVERNAVGPCRVCVFLYILYRTHKNLDSYRVSGAAPGPRPRTRITVTDARHATRPRATRRSKPRPRRFLHSCPTPATVARSQRISVGRARNASPCMHAPEVCPRSPWELIFRSWARTISQHIDALLRW